MSGSTATISYDGAYRLNLTLPSTQQQQQQQQQQHGPFLSNGKLGATLSADGRDFLDAFITADSKKSESSPSLTSASGIYANNVVQVPRGGRMRFNGLGVAEEMPVSPGTLVTSLAMDTGIATATCDLLIPGTSLPPGNQGTKAASISHDFFAHRTSPFLFAQTFRATPTAEFLNYMSALSQDDVPVYHEVVCPESMLEVKFGTNTLALPRLAGFGVRTIHLLTGTGLVASDSTSAGEVKRIAFASAYLFDASIASNGGYNVDRTRRGMAFNRIDFNRFLLAAGQEIKVHVLTATMTSADAADPEQEVQRLLLNVLARASASASASPSLDLGAAVRLDHVNAWMGMWKSNLTIEPKGNLSQADQEKTAKIRRAVRIALYNIYSCTRPGATTDLNPANVSVVDRDGSVTYDGDLFFMPALLFLNPSLAKNILVQRFKTILSAQELAASQGANGAKFPYGTDVLGYPNSLYWDVAAPVAVFNTPLIAISAWNFYRTAKDFDWLNTVGHPILRNIADYIVSIAVPVDKCGTYEFTIRNASALSGRAGDDNVFTNYLCALALKCAIEASYELNVPARETWSRVYSGMRVPYMYVPGPPQNPTPPQQPQLQILKFDAAFTATTTLKIAEPTILLTPYFDSLYYLLDDTRGPLTADAMATFYQGLIEPTYTNHPYNVIPAAIVAARAAQVLPLPEAQARMEAFESSILDFIDSNSDGTWGNLIRPGQAAANYHNDILLSSALIVAILTGPLGFRIQGGVTETRFYYQDMSVHNDDTALLPSSWERVRITKLADITATSIFNVQ
jgi:hypothetical protein